MAKYKLVLDDLFEDLAFTLVAIHCTLQDFRVAYLLNKVLSVQLNRMNNDLDYNYGSAFYSIYEWKDEHQLITWNLVSNKCKKESDALASTGSLFNTEEKSVKTYNLIPEYNSVDYFLKIKTEGSVVTEKRIVNSIQQIPQIITAYSVNTSNLKSKNNLIFS